jgi:hypothetical protein
MVTGYCVFGTVTKIGIYNLGLLQLPALDPWHKHCKFWSYNSDSEHRQRLLSLTGFPQVRIVQITAEPCQGSNKCDPLTTWCVATKCGNHPRTAPDLNLCLQRAVRGWLLQVEAYKQWQMITRVAIFADYFKFCQGNQRSNKTVARLVSQFEMKQCFQMWKEGLW